MDPIGSQQLKFCPQMLDSTRIHYAAKSIHTCNGTSIPLFHLGQLRVNGHRDNSVFGLAEQKSVHFVVVDHLAVHADDLVAVQDSAVDDVLVD